MTWFNWGKNNGNDGGRGCGGRDEEISRSGAENGGGASLGVKVLGAGCGSCREQLKYAREAVKNMGLNIEVEYVTDLRQIVAFGAARVPALVINGETVAAGKVLKPADVQKLLRQAGF